jgi:DNA-directed RNA polymerase specialized sigma54-like protein
MRYKLGLKTQTKIGPQLVIGSKLVRASGSEIEQLVSRELAQNPALELAHDSNSVGSRTKQSHGSSPPAKLYADRLWLGGE